MCFFIVSVSRLSRLSRCPKGETPETAGHFRDSGTVQMSHSSVSGVRSKSFIRLWTQLILNLVNGVDRISEDKISATVLRKFVNTVYDIMRDVKF